MMTTSAVMRFPVFISFRIGMDGVERPLYGGVVHLPRARLVVVVVLVETAVGKGAQIIVKTRRIVSIIITAHIIKTLKGVDTRVF